MKKEEINYKINKIYDYIIKYQVENGFPPSIRDICKRIGIKSTATAYSYLKKMQKMRLIEKMPQKKRAITISQKQNTFKSIPLVGSIAAGKPIYAIENVEGYYPLPPEFNVNEETFALRVKGDSMINAGIFDKDIIIVKRSNCACNGQIIVALIDDSATVKRFYYRDGQIILHPENDTMQDMVLDYIKILGIVKGLYRKF